MKYFILLLILLNTSATQAQTIIHKHSQETTKQNIKITTKEEVSIMHIFQYASLAILGGLILNLMPCTLPVISVKAVGVARASKSRDSQAAKISCMGTWCGIMAFFTAIAGSISYAKNIGAKYSWGCYFQSEYSIMAGILLMVYAFALTTNRQIFSYEVGKIRRSAFFGGFAHGLMIPFLSTPCCGPFMSSVVAIAISHHSHLLSWLIILCLGFGLGLPYLLLSMLKNPFALLPKPGKWMLAIKYLSMILSLATIAWLTWILSKNDCGLLYLSIVFVMGLLLFFTVARESYAIKAVMWLLVFIIGTFVITNASKWFIDYKYSNLSKPNAIPFQIEKMEKYLFQGKTVVVRFTADWCITCKVMDIYLFNSREINDFLSQNDVIYMVADVTARKTGEASDFMEDNKIAGVPSIYIAGKYNPAGEVVTGLMKKEEFMALVSRYIEN